MLIKLLKYILILAIPTMLGACSMNLSLKSLDSIATEGPIVLGVKNKSLLYGKGTITIDPDARLVTLTNVPAGRVYSLVFEENGQPLNSQNNLECVAGNWLQQLFGYNVYFGKTSASAIHFDLSLRETNGTLTIDCTSPRGGDFEVQINYIGSLHSMVTSSMALVPGGGLDGDRSAISADGNIVVWVSKMGFSLEDQVFARNRTTGQEYLVSSRSDKVEDAANLTATLPVISANGRYVAFVSSATNLVAGATVGGVYLKDLQNLKAAPILISSLDSTQTDQTNFQGNSPSNNISISATGRFIVFRSTATNFAGGSGTFQLYLKDLENLSAPPVLLSSKDSTQSNQTSYVGDGAVFKSSISEDGRYVVFSSNSENFVTGSPINTELVYMKDTQNLNQPPVLISSLDSTQANQTNYSATYDSVSPQISSDGRYIVFESAAGNFASVAGLNQIYLKDRLNLNLPPVLISSIDSTQADQTNFEGDQESYSPTISSDGRYISFETYAANFTNYTYGMSQVYIKDRLSLNQAPVLASSLDSSQTNQDDYAGYGESYTSMISGNGRYVVFTSTAENFYDGNINNKIFLKDLQKPSVKPEVIASSDLSQDDSALAFAGLYSENPSVSSDGRYVFFTSSSKDLVKGSNTFYQLYRKDMHNLQLNPVLISSKDSSQADQTLYVGDDKVDSYSISADGRYVVFSSSATNFISSANSFKQIYYKDLNNLAAAPVILSSIDSTQTNQTSYLSNGNCIEPSISDDGRYVVFACTATNLVTGTTIVSQIYMKDMQNLNQRPILLSSTNSNLADQTSVRGGAASTAPKISGNGQKVVFASAATNFVTGAGSTQIYIKNLASLGTAPTIVSSKDISQANQSTTYRGNGVSSAPHLSADGRYIVFLSTSTNLYSPSASGTHVFYKDLNSPALGPYLVSSIDSTQANQSTYKANQNSSDPFVSSDGRYVLFVSMASNLVTGSGGIFQVYRKDMNNMSTRPLLYSSTDPTQANQTSYRSTGTAGSGPRLSSGGEYFVFGANATNLVQGSSATSLIYYRKVSP